jgi:hypothetical protein
MTAADLAQALGIGTPVGAQTGAMQNRGVMPNNLEYDEKYYSGWHPIINQLLGNASSADPNMATAAPATNDPMEISKGKYSGLGQATQYGNDPTNVADTNQMPAIGPMPGTAVLNPSVAPQVPDGAARPMGPGEHVKNPDGSWSNEITTTTDPGAVPALNGGQPTVIPTLWVINGVPTRVDEDTAAQLAVQSGLAFPSFKTPQEAESFSSQRESNWQNVAPENSGSVPSLWSAPTPAASTGGQ